MDWFDDEDFWRDLYPFMFPPERVSAADEEVDQILALARAGSGAVLDLCCGPGRHSVAFAQRGFIVTGVDRSRFLLDRAAERASSAGVSIEWIRDDMRHFVRPAAFDLVCNMFTSFGYFDTEEDNLRVLRNVHSGLRSGAVLVIDVISKERLARIWQNAICTDLPDGSLLIQRPEVRDDWCRIRNRWTLIKDGHSRDWQFEHSLYSGRELKDRLLACGFAEVQLFGDLRGAPYNLGATRLIAVARKAA